MTPQQLAENAAKEHIELQRNLTCGELSELDLRTNKANFIIGFEKGYEDNQIKWIRVEDEGLPTDDKILYFIAKGKTYHTKLYSLSELVGMHKEYVLTSYLPFYIPLPPKP